LLELQLQLSQRAPGRTKEGQEAPKSARKRQRAPESAKERQKAPEKAHFLLELGALWRFMELEYKLELELQQQMTRALQNSDL
jgi:hypothetical protein